MSHTKQIMNPEISIVSAHVSSPSWAKLLVQSIRKYTTVPYEIVIIDNHSVPETLTWLEAQSDVRLVRFYANLRHGGSLDVGARLAKAPLVCFLDIDSHVQRIGWDTDLIALYDSDLKNKLIGVKGPDSHPLVAPLFLFEKKFVVDQWITFEYRPNDPAGDTAQQAFIDIQAKGYKVVRLELGNPLYDCGGDEVYLNGLPTFYHHGNGTRYNEHNPKIRKAILGGITIEEHLKSKERLFAQPQVREILDHGGKDE